MKNLKKGNIQNINEKRKINPNSKGIPNRVTFTQTPEILKSNSSNKSFYIYQYL